MAERAMVRPCCLDQLLPASVQACHACERRRPRSRHPPPLVTGEASVISTHLVCTVWGYLDHMVWDCANGTGDGVESLVVEGVEYLSKRLDYEYCGAVSRHILSIGRSPSHAPLIRA